MLNELTGWDVRVRGITEDGGILVENSEADDNPTAAEDT